jgi:PAS domain S-box-containing protein
MLLESTAEAIIGDDLEGNCTFCNSAALNLLGYEEPSALLNKNLHAIMHHTRPDGAPLSSEDCELSRAVREGRDYHSDEQFFWRKDGICFPAECWSHPVFEDGEITGSVLTFFDISERKRAEEQAQENRARLGAALASMTDAVIISDSNGRFLNFNDSFATYYRFKNRAECPQTLDKLGHFLDVFLPDGEPAPREMWAVPRALRGEISSSAEYGLRRKDTGETWVGSYSFGPIRDKEGSIVGSVVVARDITQQKANEHEIHKLNDELEQRVTERTAQLQAANKELEAFTYSVSHDLRAPLRHISGFSKLLVEEFSTALPPDAHHYLNRIQDGTLRMGLLVDDLLNLGRVGRQELHLQVAGLRSIVDEVIRDLEPECAGRQVEWKIGTLPFVECDPGLLKQVFQNLLANALKFTRPRSTAVIEVGQQDNSDPPAIYVRDNGVGFSMKYADKLFGVFQRLHRQEDFEGTGVGLATVQRIVEKHGGRIWAEAALDKGATFYLTLGATSNGAAKSVSVGDHT